MKHALRLMGLAAAVAIGTGEDALGCGDKYLVGARGTRYQRPKNARAASVLIYADPASGLPAALGSVRLDSVLKHEGHRSTTAETLEQLSALLAGGRYDVVLAASTVAATLEDLLAAAPDAPVLVAFCVRAAGAERRQRGGGGPCVKAPPKQRSLLEAIDKAVERYDRITRKSPIIG